VNFEDNVHELIKSRYYTSSMLRLLQEKKWKEEQDLWRTWLIYLVSMF